MDRRSTPSDEDDSNEEEQRQDEEEEQKTPLAEQEIGGEERRRRQLQQASQRARKRRKHESMLCASQLSAIRSEISGFTRLLEEAAQASPDRADAAQRATEKLVLEQRIAFLKQKLEAHETWLTELRNLLATAPLLDYALRLHELDTDNLGESTGDTTSEREPQNSMDATYAVIDEWRAQASGQLFSPILVAKHLHASASMSQDNVDKLLDEFNDAACDFGVVFSSRGWSHAAHVDDKLLTFRSSRVIPGASAKSVAAAVWRSIQLDDILRTFVPLVLDAVVVYEDKTAQRHVVERVIQLETTRCPEAMATIESMYEYGVDGTCCWRIAVETCDDPCLIAFASERISTASAQAVLPVSPVLQGAGKNLTQQPDIVIAAKCFQESNGVNVQLAGSIRHYGEWLVQANSAVELVQSLIYTMPAYEELHLLSKT